MTQVRKDPNWAWIGLAQDAFAGVGHSPAFSPGLGHDSGVTDGAAR